MHATDFISAGCVTFMATLAYALASYGRRGKRQADGPKEADVKLLPPDQFCKKVLSDRPPRMVIIQIGSGPAAPGTGRRYEFRTMEPKSGKAFRTYFDDVPTDDSGRPGRSHASQNMRTAVSHIHLLMQAADWHLGKRKGTLSNPAFYLEP